MMKIDIETANRIAANPRLSASDALAHAMKALGVTELVPEAEAEPDESEPFVAP